MIVSPRDKMIKIVNEIYKRRKHGEH